MAAHMSRQHDTSSVLPELSTLHDLPLLSQLRWSEAQYAAFRAVCDELVHEHSALREELAIGCVVRLDRGFPAVVYEDGLVRAEFSARLTKNSLTKSSPAKDSPAKEVDSKVAVGDWVCLRKPAGHEFGLIEYILPRESAVARWKGKARGERQTLAANIDLTIVVQACGTRELSIDRIARSAVIARDSGCDVAVVLTKADRSRVEELVSYGALIRNVLGKDIRIVVTSLHEREAARDMTGPSGLSLPTPLECGTDAVRKLVPKGCVAIVLGESGAGKSTLLNALLGRDVLETGAVRPSDDAGRHTTVARRMVAIPAGGVIVDEPGLRSLPLMGHERGLARVFPRINEAARSCRFRDCTHTHEPGCEVQRLCAEGAYPRERLDVYLALAAEMRASAATLDPDVMI